MLGFWLILNPFIFRRESPASIWILDFTLGLLVICLALLSFWEKTQKAHLVLAVLSLGIIGFGYFGAQHPLPGTMQNYIVTGLCLLMFAIIPNDSNLPSEGWRNHYFKKE